MNLKEFENYDNKGGLRMRKEDLDKRICDVELEADNIQTYREFIVEAEKEIGTGSADLDNMTDEELTVYLDFLDELLLK
ncbi:hypothetical protein NAV10_12745 [Clostridioides difficile]|nr:hypothetical protein [Clostridioides difficile]